MYYAVAVLAVVFTAFGHICFKKLALKTLGGGSVIRRWRDGHLVAGGILFVLSAVSGVIALKGLDFSVFYSLTALTYLFISVLANIHLKERIDRAKIIGNLMVIIGILVYNLC